jgi:hypothetical protein
MNLWHFSKFYNAAQNLQLVSQRLAAHFQEIQTSSDINPFLLLERFHKVQSQCLDVLKVLESLRGWRERYEQQAQQLLNDHERLCRFRKSLGLSDLDSDPKENLQSTLAILCRFENKEMSGAVKHHEMYKQNASFGNSPDDNILLPTAASNKNSKLKYSTKNFKPKSLSQRTETEFVPVTEEEFLSISDTIRGRCKLEDLNSVWRVLFEHYVSKQTLKITELASMGYRKLVGQTGKAILKTLQHLKLINVSKTGEISLICFAVENKSNLNVEVNKRN